MQACFCQIAWTPIRNETAAACTVIVMAKGTSIIALIFLLGLPSVALAEGGAPSISACERCHGPRGDSGTAHIPRLNGQQEEYLAARLQSFLAPNPPNLHYKLWRAQAGEKTDVGGLAKYFAHQTPRSPPANSSLAAAGAEIFRHGAQPAIPACSGCHGQRGEGHGAVPRIAGQHATYLMNQLEAFSGASRKGEPMNRHTWDMTLGQMQAVSDYLSND